jgi:GTP-binding protein
VSKTVAILGRPNVGKSTLYNRLVERRRAIVDDTPGVTRDRLEGEGRLFDLRFRVIDTAGMDEGAPGSLPARLRAQSEAALDDADVGLFVIDAKAGVTALDETLAAVLREHGKPLILLANKAESDAGALALAEAWRLTLGEPVPVAAAHGQGMDELAEALRPFLAPAADEEEPEPDAEAAGGPLRLAVLGRPNVGKSSLINRLLGSERLLTGPELVDTAGLRRRTRIDARSLEKVATSATIEALKYAAVGVLVIDATQPLERQDQTIADLVVREGRALVLALNKWDLVDEPEPLLKEIRWRLEAELAQVKGVPAVPVSAVTGSGVKRLLATLVRQHDRWATRVGTGELNRWLQAMLEHTPPPMVKGRRIKLRYITQPKARPPTFALFGNQLDHLPESYLRYLAGGLRERFDFQGVPIRWRLRQGTNPYAD